MVEGTPRGVVSGGEKERAVQEVVKRHLLDLLQNDPVIQKALKALLSQQVSEIAAQVIREFGKKDFLRRGDVRAEALRYGGGG